MLGKVNKMKTLKSEASRSQRRETSELCDQSSVFILKIGYMVRIKRDSYIRSLVSIFVNLNDYEVSVLYLKQ